MAEAKTAERDQLLLWCPGAQSCPPTTIPLCCMQACRVSVRSRAPAVRAVAPLVARGRTTAVRVVAYRYGLPTHRLGIYATLPHSPTRQQQAQYLRLCWQQPDHPHWHLCRDVHREEKICALGSEVVNAWFKVRELGARTPGGRGPRAAPSVPPAPPPPPPARAPPSTLGIGLGMGPMGNRQPAVCPVQTSLCSPRSALNCRCLCA